MAEETTSFEVPNGFWKPTLWPTRIQKTPIYEQYRSGREDAKELCKKANERLPSLKELGRLVSWVNSHPGVLPSQFIGNYFWVSDQDRTTIFWGLIGGEIYVQIVQNKDDQTKISFNSTTALADETNHWVGTICVK